MLLRNQHGKDQCPAKSRDREANEWRCEFQKDHPGPHVKHVPQFPGSSIRIWES